MKIKDLKKMKEGGNLSPGKGYVSKDTRAASAIGTTKFRLSLDKENVKDPNYRIDKVLTMFEDRPYIKSQMNQLVLFIINELTAKGEDEEVVQFYNDWIKMRPVLKIEMENLALLGFGAGTAYLEPTYKRAANGNVIVDNLFNVADPSMIYENVFKQSDDDYWLLRVPYDVRLYDGKKAEFVPINYIRGSYLQRNFIWAVKYPKDKYLRFKYGWNRCPWYGGGLLSAAVDDFDTEQMILKNWALMAKFRALGKKIIGFYSDDGESVDMPEIDRIRDELMQLEEEDNLIVNRKFVSEDLAFNGTDNTLNEQIEYLRKDIGGGLTPNYMTAFSQDSSLATASEAKVPFSLQLKSMQENLVRFLNKIIVEGVAPGYDWIDTESVSIDLGKPELYSRTELFEMVSQLYNNQAATFNEYRQAAGYDAVEGGDKWGEDIPLDKMNTVVATDAKQMSESLSENKEFMRVRKSYLKESKVVMKELAEPKIKRFPVKVEQTSMPVNPHQENMGGVDKMKTAVKELFNK